MKLHITLSFFTNGTICEVSKDYKANRYRISNFSAVRMQTILKRLEERTGELVEWDVAHYPDFHWYGNYHKGDSNE